MISPKKVYCDFSKKGCFDVKLDYGNICTDFGFYGLRYKGFFGATYDVETRWEKLRLGGVGVAFAAIGIMFFSMTTRSMDNSVAEARDIHVCRTTLEQALTEYRADFGTEAVLALSESDNLVSSLAKEYDVNGKRVGSYIYDQTVIGLCSAKKWRIRPMTATTLHIDLISGGKE